MLRIVGFLIGSAVSVITLLLIVGIPHFNFANTELDDRRFDEAVERLKQKKQEVELVAKQFVEEMTEPEVADISEQIVSEPMVEGWPATESQEEPVPLQAAVTEIPAGPQWHSFWSPFASEIAAKGFVSQLEKVTGLDYRVDKLDIGVYEVVFAYSDDRERRDILTQIAAATGLEFPDS